MAKSSLSQSKTDETETVEATGDIIEGSPTSGALAVSGAGVVGDIDASDIEFPKLAIAQGVGPLSDNFKKGAIVLDAEHEISDGTTPVEFTVLRIGKFFEENIPFGTGEIPRIVTPAEQKQIGGTTQGHRDGENYIQPDWKPLADALVCIKGDNEDVFPYNFGKDHYAIAMWRIRKTAYEGGAKPILTAAGTYYRHGLRNGSFLLTTQKRMFSGNAVHGPKVVRGKKHDEKFVNWLASEFC